MWWPTGQGGSAHGGPHWDVQYPGGGGFNMHPGGRRRDRR
ncbi:polymorphic toxin type 37 domain-containing protein [Hydrogenophaga sp. XSHU_21]